MGTHSLTNFKNESGTTMASVYGQWDGNPENHGTMLTELAKKENNGFECLALSMIAGLKTEPKSYYLAEPGGDEEWEYNIIEKGNDVLVEILHHGEMLWDGDIKECDMEMIELMEEDDEK